MSETTSSSSTLISSSMAETFVPKTMLGTTVKLNGSNYLLWVQAFHIFIGAQNKLAYLLQPLPVDTNLTYVTWLTGDYSVMTWLLNSLEEKISGTCMTRERRGQEFAVKVFLESNEKDYNKNTVPSGYKGGRILNLEFPLCLMLGSSCGGGE